MSEVDRNVPVIVGVGQINDRNPNPNEAHDSIGLMQAALEQADRDAGGGWLQRMESLAVVDQISFRFDGDVSELLADRMGIAPKIRYKSAYASGDSPILFLNEAANRIGAGEIEVAAIAGGEALRTASRRAALAAGDGKTETNAIRMRSSQRKPAYRDRYGLSTPVDVYPLYENAGRAAYRQTLDEGQQESAEIWSRFSEVAAENPAAWIRNAVTAEDIRTPSPDNRPITFPYTKLMVANSSVNQGAAFIVTSLKNARDAGLEASAIYVGAGAAAHEPGDFLARDSYQRSVSMEISLRQALGLNGLTSAELDHVELYSCFPCVPKMARRVIDWPIDRPASVVGGLTFGGGPIGNYMSHAVVRMVEKLRNDGTHGLLFANGGFATSNHSIVLSRTPVPAGTFPQNFDFQSAADAARDAAPMLVEDYQGPGTIETYTVLYDRAGQARFGIIVGLTGDGRRFLSKILPDNREGIAFLEGENGDPVGTAGHAVAGPDGLTLWQRG